MKQPQDKSTLDIEDIFLWPDGAVCYRNEVTEEVIQWKGDDFRVVYCGTPEYLEIMKETT